MSLRSLALGLCAALLLGSSAFAAPIVNGTVGAGEYDDCIADTYVFGAADETGQDYYTTGLDIDTMCFHEEAGTWYLGLTTVAAYLPSGSPSTSTGLTDLLVKFYETAPTGPGDSSWLWAINIATDAGVERIEILENTLAGRVTTLVNYGLRINELGIPTLDPTIPSKVTVAYADALEASIDGSLFTIDPNDAPYFFSQLDDTGAWDDDQAMGLIPEPATLALLAMGGLAMLRRRR